MEIEVSKRSGNVEVTVLRLSGELDSQNYQDLIGRAKELYASGARYFLLDMRDLTYVSSAGLVAMHTIALLSRGEAVEDSENGWAAMKSAKKASAGEKEERIKLLNPRAEVRSVLEMVGFERVFEIHSSLEDALKSF
ncbi:MAG: STAS domain-containing protein [Anaerolineales bacterium]|nr:STAS domain-containing protein [Anaerolineales bacterium]